MTDIIFAIVRDMVEPSKKNIFPGLDFSQEHDELRDKPLKKMSNKEFLWFCPEAFQFLHLTSPIFNALLGIFLVIVQVVHKNYLSFFIILGAFMIVSSMINFIRFLKVLPLHKLAKTNFYDVILKDLNENA